MNFLGKSTIALGVISSTIGLLEVGNQFGSKSREVDRFEDRMLDVDVSNSQRVLRLQEQLVASLETALSFKEDYIRIRNERNQLRIETEMLRDEMEDLLLHSEKILREDLAMVDMGNRCHVLLSETTVELDSCYSDAKKLSDRYALMVNKALQGESFIIPDEIMYKMQLQKEIDVCVGKLNECRGEGNGPEFNVSK